MLLPRKVSDCLEKMLPRFVSRGLHCIYDPYFRWELMRMNRRVIRQLFPSGQIFIPGGPFAGMKYLPVDTPGALLPKLVGSYEEELHPTLTQVIQRDYQALVDIGCAEGYYLVGLAWKLPGAAVHGFDMNPSALELCREIAALNGVAGRLQLHGRCTVDNLQPVTGPKTFVLCDCEGTEAELLDPARVPGLKQSDILVELHSSIVPGIEETIRERFAPTHKVHFIPARPRKPEDYPSTGRLSPRSRRFAVNEFRVGKTDWAFIESSP